MIIALRKISVYYDESLLIRNIVIANLLEQLRTCGIAYHPLTLVFYMCTGVNVTVFTSLKKTIWNSYCPLKINTKLLIYRYAVDNPYV